MSNVKEQFERKKPLVDVSKREKVMPDAKSLQQGQQIITEKGGKK